jgi:hypothetical protein
MATSYIATYAHKVYTVTSNHHNITIKTNSLRAFLYFISAFETISLSFPLSFFVTTVPCYGIARLERSVYCSNTHLIMPLNRKTGGKDGLSPNFGWCGIFLRTFFVRKRSHLTRKMTILFQGNWHKNKTTYVIFDMCPVKHYSLVNICLSQKMETFLQKNNKFSPINLSSHIIV